MPGKEGTGMKKRIAALAAALLLLTAVRVAQGAAVAWGDRGSDVTAIQQRLRQSSSAVNACV